MPRLEIERSHSLDPTEVQERLDELNSQLAASYGMKAQWKSPTEATLEGAGASGSLLCTPGRVVVVLDLPFTLWPLKSRIASRIRHELARALADQSS